MFRELVSNLQVQPTILIRPGTPVRLLVHRDLVLPAWKEWEQHMADLKLPRIPDRKPVKFTISILPDLHQAIVEYAALYSQTYGRE